MRGTRVRPAGRSKWLVGSLTAGTMAALLLAAYLWRADGRAPALAADRAPVLAPAPTTIVPGIHLLGGLGPSAAYAVETAEGLVLVDSGLEEDANRLKSQLIDLGLDWRRVRAILITHVHGDHSGGAMRLRAETGAKVYAGRGDASVLRAGGPKDAFFSTFHMPNDNPHPTEVDVELAGDETLAFGDARFRAIATPGHTPGSICYLLELGGLRVLFGGDVIMSLRGEDRSDSKRGPLGTYSAYLPPRYRGDAGDTLGSLRKLRALPVPDLVFPGHPRADPTPQSPRLSRRRWEAMLDRGIRDMETLLDRYRRDGADFLDGAPKELLPGLDYLGEFHDGAVYGLFVGSKFFVVDAPGGPGLADFLEERLRRLGRAPAKPTAVLLTSGGPSATAGLRDLLGRYPARVVAPAEALASLKESCPDGTVFLAAEDLAKQGWFPVTTIPLRGRGEAAVAFQVPRGDKVVLFSGRMPVPLNQGILDGLFADLSKSKGLAFAYLESLIRLRDLKPDLWLPAVPVDGQNANLYDEDWARVISDNWGVIEKNLKPAA